MAFKFFDKVYTSWDAMVEGVMEDYPEYTYSSDASLDFIEMHAEDIEEK